MNIADGRLANGITDGRMAITEGRMAITEGRLVNGQP